MENNLIKDGFKPMLPMDCIKELLKFPLIASAKLDGVASINRHGVLLGRSLKQHENEYTTALFSKDEYHGLCGEMTLDNKVTGDDLCRLTSGALRRIKGEPKMQWNIFDYCTDENKHLPYVERFAQARALVQALNNPDIVMIDYCWIHSQEELDDYETYLLDLGYEGVIIRDHLADYKYGRCGKTHRGAWRIKTFIHEEILCTSIEEGVTNNNESKVNELGRSERSTHQENLVPNGTVGSIKGTLLKDVLDPQSRKLLVPKGTLITVGPGNMPHGDRGYYFRNQHEIVGKVVKFKMFPKGIKDTVRFPTFVLIKNDNDMEVE